MTKIQHEQINFATHFQVDLVAEDRARQAILDREIVYLGGLTEKELDERVKSDPRYKELFERFRKEELDRLRADDAPQLPGLERRLQVSNEPSIDIREVVDTINSLKGQGMRNSEILRILRGAYPVGFSRILSNLSVQSALLGN